jgi:hypothetical protein
MYKKNLLKNLVIPAIALALVVSPFTSPVSTFAAEKSVSPESTDISQVKQQGINDELKAKVDPYVSIKNGKFVIDKTVFNVLTNEEKIEVENLVAESNQLVSTEKGISQIGNHFVQTASQSTQGKFFARSSSFYINANYTWWGLQYQFSHKAVKDLSSFAGLAGNLSAGKTLQEFLIKHGLTVAGKWMGPISLYGTVIFWAMGQVDKGNGVNLNCVLYVPATITAR